MSGDCGNVHVGYLWSEKKNQKYGRELLETGRRCGIEFVKLQVDKPLEPQGPFTAIVAPVVKTEKDFDLLVYKEIAKYTKRHPEVTIIEPVANGVRLVNRYRQYKLVDETLRAAGGAFVPAFVELTSKNVPENISKMQVAGVGFPVVCKPTCAHGSSLAHQMCIIFNEEGLKDISPPCVVQQFINHDAVLYKLCVLGDEYFVFKRPSLKNFSAGDQQTIYFNSHLVSKPNCDSDLSYLDKDEPKTVNPPERKRVDHIVQAICSSLEFSLVGIDLIIDNVTGAYAIIDINAFPGYDNLENFIQLYCDFVLSRISSHQKGLKTTFTPTLSATCPNPFLDANHFDEEVVDSALPSPTKKCMDVLPYDCPASSVIGLGGDHLALCVGNSSLKLNLNKEISGMLESLNAKEKEKTSFPFTVLNQSPDSTQDDSGIETSDSCDEKKKATVLKGTKRQHSRHYRITAATAEETT